MNVYFKDTINKPAEEVYTAIVDQQHMQHYFISRASGPLAEGASIQWEFADAGVTVAVQVLKMIPNERIQFSWAATGAPNPVTIALEKVSDSQTAITITESGWNDDKEGMAKTIQQSIGWTHFFCCLKAYLLFGVNLRAGTVVADKHNN